MDATSLMLGIVFGSIGLGFLMYGRKAGLVIPLCVGLVLMICPYLIPNTLILIITSVILIVLPFVFRDI